MRILKFLTGPEEETALLQHLSVRMLEGKDPQETIEFSAAYSALCHGFMGDWNWATRAEAEKVMKGGSARVVR